MSVYARKLQDLRRCAIDRKVAQIRRKVGCAIMTATKRNWALYSDSNLEELRRIISETSRTEIPRGIFALTIGWDVSAFSRWRTGSEALRSMKAVHYHHAVALLRNFNDQNYLDPEEGPVSSDPAFLGLCQFLEATQASIDQAKESFCGVYESYRYSHRLAEQRGILRGLTEISQNAAGDALVTHELYRIQSGMIVGMNEIFFERKGYFVPHVSRPRMVSKKIAGAHDLQMIFIRNPLPNGSGSRPNDINTMKGIIVDWEGDQFYSTAIYMVRVDSRKSIAAAKTKNGSSRVVALTPADLEYQRIVPELKIDLTKGHENLVRF